MLLLRLIIFLSANIMSIMFLVIFSTGTSRSHTIFIFGLADFKSASTFGNIFLICSGLGWCLLVFCRLALIFFSTSALKLYILVLKPEKLLEFLVSLSWTSFWGTNFFFLIYFSTYNSFYLINLSRFFMLSLFLSTTFSIFFSLCSTWLSPTSRVKLFLF